MRTHPTSREPLQGGFSLLELAIVLVISGILLNYGLKTTMAYVEGESRKITRDRLAAIEEALVLFASRQKRLPCPADASLGETSTSNGLEQLDTPGNTTTCKGGIQYSAVPWRELGISQEVALDGWRRKITYRAHNGNKGVTRPNGLDMKNCQASGTNPQTETTDCSAVSPFHRPTAFLSGKGLTVNSGDPTDKLMPLTSDSGGAAFVLVSHGKDGLGAYLTNGARLPLPSTSQVAQFDNVNDASQFADAKLDENANSSTYFDDVVSRRSIDWTAVRAGLGPQ